MDVTVVIPAMNRESLIQRALASVAAQTCPAVAVIVVDDASDDATALRAEQAGAEVVRLPTRSGSGPARNAGLVQVTTPWVAFLDSDDVWHSDHLELLSRALGDHVLVTSPAVSSSGIIRGNALGRALALDPVALLVPGDIIVTSGTVVRRDVLEAVGGFRALQGAEDLDLWLRVLEHGTGLATGQPTVEYLEHESQSSRDGRRARLAFDHVLAGCATQPWMTKRVRTQAYSRIFWDDMRQAQRGRRWGAAARHAVWFAQHPVALPALWTLLDQRRRARRR